MPMPVMADVLQSLGQGNTLDLKSAFWQIKLTEESKQITTFSTDKGHFEFNRMPFGLKNAPRLQRLMNSLFKDKLGKSLNKLLFLKKKEDMIFHTVKEGINTNSEKIRAITEFPTPKNDDQHRSFVGTTYYRHFELHLKDGILRKGIMGIDLLKLPPSRQDSYYVLAVAEYFSKYTILVPLPDKSAETVAQALVDNIFCRYNIHCQLLSENGTEFRNEVFQNIDKLYHTAYHPQGSGLVDRTKVKIIEVLRPLQECLCDTWEDWLSQVQASINGSINSATKNRTPKQKDS
ncbi:uncharacterized protein LOC143035923 [Oratosquilla oratoria]|uniref:uncharacterized protein LOC143035923 n=1 Tax=Oratosquilla oratoria TaxID=337810 RepID=UPI003F77113F